MDEVLQKLFDDFGAFGGGYFQIPGVVLLEISIALDCIDEKPWGEISRRKHRRLAATIKKAVAQLPLDRKVRKQLKFLTDPLTENR